MRYIPAFIILIHGCIHCMGFSKAFGYSNFTAITKTISRAAGAVWLLVFFIFMAAVILLVLKKQLWWLPALTGAVVSQILIITVWQDAKYGTITNILILAMALAAFGEARFFARYKKDVTAYVKNSGMFHPGILTEEDITALPGPVKKYLRYTHAVGQSKIKNFQLTFSGNIRKKGQKDWMPFTSEQYNFTEAATRLFYMNARMMQLPVTGYHCYKNGTAFMDIRLLSLFTVQYQQGNEMNIAETVTFFNDMCCMAPATLIDSRIKWLSTEGNTVQASFTINAVTINAVLIFNDEGQLVNFISDNRYAQMTDGSMQRLQWSTPLKDYKEINGYRLASHAETVYQYPDGAFVYGSFNLTSIHCNINPQ
jgi:hypothetical protein